MVLHLLTQAKLDKITCKGKYHDGGGLYLEVSAKGTKSWTYRYGVLIDDGKRKDRNFGLGPYPRVSLAEARADHRFWSERRRKEGIDPLLTRDAEKRARKLEASKSTTFRECAEGYLEARKPSWTSRYHADAKRKLELFAYPTWGDHPVAEIMPRHVADLLKPIQNRSAVVRGSTTNKGMKAGGAPTAEMVRLHLKGVFDYAAAQEVRTGDNPASKTGALSYLLPRIEKIHRVVHQPALPFEQIGIFMSKLRGYTDQRGAHSAIDFVGRGHTVMAFALEFLILTGVRRGQVAVMKWADLKISTIPKNQFGSRRQRRLRQASQQAMTMSCR